MKSLFILMFTGIVALSACKSKNPIVERNDSIYVEKMVGYPVPADSASIEALIECDENGKAILRKFSLESSKNAHLHFLIDSIGNLKAKFKNNPDTVYAPSKTIIIRKTVTKYETKYKEKKVSIWAKIRGTLSTASGTLVILCTVLLIRKLKK